MLYNIVPGGSPHPIGKGIFMVEIMEPTDLVVPFEFERGGYTLPEAARFMNRGLDFALDMVSFDPLPVEIIKENYFCKPVVTHKNPGYEEAVLIGPTQTPCFSVHKLTINRPVYARVECLSCGDCDKRRRVHRSGA